VENSLELNNMSVQVDEYRIHKLQVLAGHGKRNTRLLHLITTQGMLAFLLLLLTEHTYMPAWFLCGGLLLSNLRQAQRSGNMQSRFRLHVAIGSWLTTGLVFLCLLTMWPWTGVMGILGGFLGCGLPEQYSHQLFGDADLNLVTADLRGLQKARAILYRVMLPAPVYFTDRH
jgi:hypothetical protein